MRQILQNLQTGETELAEVPTPRVGRGRVLIQTRRSLISTGTERMLVHFARANLLQKAQQQPQRIRQVLDKVRTDGLATTLRAVRAKLSQPLPLGYCNAGVVIAVGDGVRDFKPGDRVVSNGPHAEIVCVPKNLCAKIPEGVSFDAAVFTVAAAIGLQGLRLAQPTLGESFVVTGLGLLGLLTAQLLRAQGCRVLGLDLAEDKLELARSLGIEVCHAGADPVGAATAWSRGRGVDGVIITASTRSSEPVHQAAQMCRKRGRIVLVGVTGLELDRADFYEKELSFQVSCSYGPGRYDATYEEQGLDYPIGWVRWTEQRNFEAVLDLLAQDQLEISRLISAHFPIARATDAYRQLEAEGGTIALLLDYAEALPELTRDVVVTSPTRVASGRPVSVGAIGAGNYATQVLLPALAETGARLHTVASSGGRSGVHAARTLGFENATTDTEALLENPEVDAIVILTRHGSHARLVCEALDRGKHVFVEKPLAITAEGLAEVEAARARALERGDGVAPVLMVGFNRRFAPQVVELSRLLASERAPRAFVMTVNAGAIPSDHWTQDRAEGGGRLIGEGCHFVDLLRHLSGQPITRHQVMALEPTGGENLLDTLTVTLGFADGSVGTIHYFSNGHRSLSKERLEVFCGGKVLQLDNFRSLRGFGWPGLKRRRRWSQDKGNAAGIAAFIDAIERGAPDPIPFEELVEVTRVCLTLERCLV